MAGTVTGTSTPQQNTTVFASKTYSAPQASTPVAVPSDHSNFLITVDRSNLPNTPADVLRIRIDHSADGGATWSPNPSGEKNWPHGPFPITFTVPGRGNIAVAPAGASAAVSSVGLDFLPGTNKQLRVTVTPLQPISTQVKLATASGSISASAVGA